MPCLRLKASDIVIFQYGFRVGSILLPTYEFITTVLSFIKCLYLCYLYYLTSLVVCAQEQQMAGVVYFQTKSVCSLF
jgi:hypothetical protein